jgi:hypothetical protein
MALHVDAALHVEPVENVTQNSIQAAIEHGCWRAAADVEGGHRPFADESGVDIDLAQDGLRVSLRCFRVINHFVVGTVRTYLLTEGNVEIEAEGVDVSEPALKGG